MGKETKYNKNTFLELYSGPKTSIKSACEGANIGRSTYYNWMKKDEEFRQRVKTANEEQIDYVEEKLMSLIDSGDPAAIMFYLKTKGKSRGYSDKAVPETQAEEERRKEQETSKKVIEKKIKSKKNYIIKLLKEQGKYTAELTYQVEITAQLLVRAEILNEQVLCSKHGVLNIEYSREGNERITINPLEKLYQDTLSKSQKALQALGMNTESKERKSDNDTLSDFFSAMNED